MVAAAGKSWQANEISRDIDEELELSRIRSSSSGYLRAGVCENSFLLSSTRCPRCRLLNQVRMPCPIRI
jgi:phage FluMu protein Com